AVGGDHGGGDGGPRGRRDRGRGARQGRRTAGHRRPWQLRDDARPGHRRAAHLAYGRPGRPGVRRQPPGAAARRWRAARPGADDPRPARARQARRDDRRDPAGSARMTEPACVRLAWAALVLLAAALLAPPEALAQRDSREAERRLERVRKELDDVASERRRLEGERGDAARQLRAADEQVARSARTLRDTETELARQQAALAELATQRDALQARVDAQRGELHALLRSAYASGGAAPLKLLLAQDQVAEASRALTYHRYLQRQRASRIEALRQELDALEALERGIGERQAELEQVRAQQRAQVQALEGDRRTHAQAVARIDRRYRDR